MADVETSLSGEGKTDTVCKDVADLLKQVYQAHMEAITLVQSKVQDLEKKCAKQDQRNARLLRKGRDLQEQYDDLSSEAKALEKNLSDASSKLSVPCKDCQILRGQLEQQEKLYHMMVPHINKHGDKNEHVETAAYRTVLVSLDDISDDSHSQSQTLMPKRAKSCNQSALQKPDQSKTLSHLTDKSGTSSQKEIVPVEETSPGGGKGRSLKLARNSKRTRTKYTEESVPEPKKHRKNSPDKSDISDNSTLDQPQALLLHNAETQDPGYHDVHVSILAPETCDPDVTMAMYRNSSKTMKQKKCVNFDVEDNEELPGTASRRRQKAAERPHIVIPETMQFDLDNPDYIYDDDSQGAEEDGVNSESKNETEPTVIRVGISPPSHASTPLNPGGHRKLHDVGASPCKLQAQQPKHLRSPSAQHFNQSPPRHATSRQESLLSESSSPVFERSKDSVKRQDRLTKSSHSPSLFDDDDQQEQGESSKVKSASGSPLSKRLLYMDLTHTESGSPILRKNRDLDTENTVCSPSVLSGKKLHSYSNGSKTVTNTSLSSSSLRLKSKSFRNEESERVWQCKSPKSKPRAVSENSSPNRMGKKLIQTTLRLPGNMHSNKSFDPDETRDAENSRFINSPHLAGAGTVRSKIPQSKDVSEHKLLELALEESRKQFEREKTSREDDHSHNLTFTEPQFTSTQRNERGTKSKSSTALQWSEKSQFKKPLPPKSRSKERQKDFSKLVDLDLDVTKDMAEDEPKIKTMETMASMYPAGSEMNGTIDPNVNLSEYNTPEVLQIETDSQLQMLMEENADVYLEPVSVYSIETGKYEQTSQCADVTRSQGQISQGQGQTRGTQANMRRSTRNSQQSENQDDMTTASAKSVVFGGRRTGQGQRSGFDDSFRSRANQKLDSHEADVEFVTCPDNEEADTSADFHDSFDRVPQQKPKADFAYVDVVRKRNERNKLQAFTCQQCEEYFSTLDLSEAEKKERMKHCRHKARYARPPTPEHYWSVKFPDTQEAEERGYLNTTQAKPSRFRRRRGFKPMPKDGEDRDGDK